MIHGAWLMPLVIVVALLPGGAREAPAIDGWLRPQCPAVAGAGGAVTYSPDAGATTVRNVPEAQPVTYGRVVVLQSPNRLLALEGDMVQASVDAGCTWVPIATGLELDGYDLVAGVGAMAYAVSPNRQQMYEISAFDVRAVTGPVVGDGVVGFATDPRQPGLLRAVDPSGQLHESTDAGGAWHSLGRPPGADLSLYTARFAPDDPDVVVVGTMRDGAYLSTDAGGRWTRAKGLAPKNGPANVFTVEFSPTDPRMVWLEGYDLAASDDVARRIWLSRNGGRRFKVVLDGSDAKLINGPVMAASPADPDVVYFVFGTWFGGYGTDLYRYDAGSRSLVTLHHGYDDIASIAFHPTEPDVMYLGLAEER